MSYKHSKIAKNLLEEVGILYEVPTPGHYKIVHPETGHHILWFPKSNTYSNSENVGLLISSASREKTVEFIKDWLEEDIRSV